MPNGLQFKIYEAGHCVHPSFVVKPGSSIKPRIFPAAVALVRHPEHGYILFDTGYHADFFKVTRPFPERLYAWITPCHFKAENSIVAQLAQENIQIKDVDHLVLSHFHADHIAALREFTHSQIHCTQAGIDAITNSKRMGGVRKGYLRRLIPDHIHQQLSIHNDFTTKLGEIVPSLNNIELNCKPMFNDDSIYLVNLPGHAAGQIGMLIKMTQSWIFLLADACWLIESLSQNINQHWLANILCDDIAAYHHTLNELRKCYQQGKKNIHFVPSHCLSTVRALCQKGWIQ